jgi:hypothetical protein
VDSGSTPVRHSSHNVDSKLEIRLRTGPFEVHIKGGFVMKKTTGIKNAQTNGTKIKLKKLLAIVMTVVCLSGFSPFCKTYVT